MIIRTLFFIIVALFFPHILFAVSSPPIEQVQYGKMLQYANQVIALGKIIERNTESPLLDRIIFQREALTNVLKEIYTGFDF